ncbi:putative lipid II flippase FtsW [Patescibacteria group bacterium]|nr:putative lipid II flippase FtsW [Patescibacteria group bacterium]
MKFVKNLINLFVQDKRKQDGQPDRIFLLLVGALTIIGLVMLSSASAVVSYAKFTNTYHYFLHQLIAVAIGAGLFFIFAKQDYRLWRRYALWALVASVLLLVLVFIPGLRAEHGSARSWIIIFGQSFQPSELVKLSFLIYLATWLEAKKEHLHEVASGIIPLLGSLLIIGGLMLAQPDFGTLFIILFASFAAFFVAGGKLSHIFITMLLGIIFLGVMFYANSSYQSNRFRCYQNPSYASQDECYQINQSLIAVGSGGWLGRGLGQSRQKFMYLPEVWGDSIFPIVAEEIGFIFSSLFIFIYGLLFYRGIKIARAAPDIYGTALAVGIVAWLSVQTFLNIGGMLNLIPMTGVPLPFVSAGGSSIIATLMAMGILANISKHSRHERR